MNSHHCRACKGTGKIRSKSTQTMGGVKRIHTREVECPNKLAELMDTAKLRIQRGER